MLEGARLGCEIGRVMLVAIMQYRHRHGDDSPSIFEMALYVAQEWERGLPKADFFRGIQHQFTSLVGTPTLSKL